MDRILHDLTRPTEDTRVADQQPSTTGRTDAQVLEQLDSRNLDTRLAENTLMGGIPTYGNGATTSGGGGYTFDPRQLEAHLTKLQQMRIDLVDDRQSILALERCTAPAPDEDSSQMQASAVRTFGAHLRDDNQTMTDILSQRIQELQEAKRQYMTQEDITEDQWKKLTKGS